MFKDIKWISENANKICPFLRRKIMQIYRPWKWVPRFLHKPLAALKNLFIRHRVIVQLEQEAYALAMQARGGPKIHGCKVKHRLDTLACFSTEVSTKKLQQIVAAENVTKVWEDRKVQALLNIATPAVDAPPLWNSNIDGRDVGIAVIDTGIDPHPDLTRPTNRIKAFKDYIRNRSKPYDDNGHGTHVAGDAAGNGFKSNGLYRGPAPRANLIGVKVLNKYGWGYVSTVIAGIQWCISNKDRYGIKIISMSLGAEAYAPASEDPLCQAAAKAWDAGLVVCVAAGNSGPGSATIDSPGIEPKVITVGATNDNNTTNISDDSVASFSSRGPTIDGIAKPDVVSPGVKIASLRVSGSYLDKSYPYYRIGKYYSSLSGTSMATPICAGVAAQLLQESPTLTPNEVKSLLTGTCREIDPDPNVQGAGLIDAVAAVDGAGM